MSGAAGAPDGPVVVVCTSSVTRALLVSLLEGLSSDVHAAESVARAVELVRTPPRVVFLEGAIARASADALDKLRGAWRAPVPVVLADRAYADERRGAEDARAFGAAAFVAVPSDAGAVREAVRRATGEAGASAHAPVDELPPDAEAAPPSDEQQRMRYIERLFARLDALDAYQLLRVSPTASQREILDAFRARALEFHPDRNVGLDEAARERVYQIFKRVSWAFRRVGEAHARKEYDASRPKPG